MTVWDTELNVQYLSDYSMLTLNVVLVFFEGLKQCVLLLIKSKANMSKPLLKYEKSKKKMFDYTKSYIIIGRRKC